MSTQIGDRIALIRGELSQPEFARRVGVHKNTLGRYETGERDPDAAFLQRLCVLRPDINPAWLLLGDAHQMQSATYATRTEAPRAAYSVDIDRLRVAVEAVEQVLDEEDLELEAPKKAELIVTLYELSEGEKSVQRGTILRLVKLAR